jgi:hypothetical protein
MRVLKTRRFVRFAKGEQIGDTRLVEAIHRAERGLVDADLGSGVIKQRVNRPGQGKRAGYRTLIAYRPGARAVFLVGFAKKERDNIKPDELENLRLAAADLLAASALVITEMLRQDRLIEVDYEQEEEN